MRVRRTVVLLVLLVAAALPASAFAAPPSNDALFSAIPLNPTYAGSLPTSIPPVGPGGWTDATSTEDGAYPFPTCLGKPVYHSMWYSIRVPEASVLTLTLSSSAVARFQPVVTVMDASYAEQACGLGGSDINTDPSAIVSTFLMKGTYFVRIASVDRLIGSGEASEGPTLTLLESMQDVTPPGISVSVSGTTRIVGPGKEYRFDANGSRDDGSGIDTSKAVWEFFEDGKPTVVSGTLIARHTWAIPGIHEVTLRLVDISGNRNTYSFSVLVHNFVPPVVSLAVSVPAPGSRTLRVALRHNVPISVRLVVLQGSRVLRAIHSRLVPGSRTTTALTIVLRRKVGKVGFVAVSGVASDIGPHPNTVPLLTCSVDPINRGGKCG